jgi:hypothetical protein
LEERYVAISLYEGKHIALVFVFVPFKFHSQL